ncbi:MAG TPA: hypothetical protein VMA72_02185 [Streptosporangiaceae bacterium]|nr:hypothetical protein [Streptosporangiaceae bacterium]
MLHWVRAVGPATAWRVAGLWRAGLRHRAARRRLPAALGRVRAVGRAAAWQLAAAWRLAGLWRAELQHRAA